MSTEEQAAQAAERPHLKWTPPPKGQPISELEQGMMLAMWALRHKIQDFTLLVPDADKQEFEKTLAFWGQEPMLVVQRVPTGTKGGKFSRRGTDGKMVEIDNPVVKIEPHSTVIQMVDRTTQAHITPGRPDSEQALWDRKALDKALDDVERLCRGGAMQGGRRIFSSDESDEMCRVMVTLRNHIRGQ